MASRQTQPSPQSKIPKLQTAPSSPRTNRTPSILQGSPPQATASKPQIGKTVKSTPSSPRKPISFRTPSHYVSPVSPRGSPSIKSKSDGQSRGQREHISTQQQKFPPRGTMLDRRGQEQGDTIGIQDQKRTGSQNHVSKNKMENALTGLIRPASQQVTEEDEDRLAATLKQFSRPEMKSPCQGSESIDVNVLYAASPIQMMESTSSVAPPCPKKSPTYLDIYRQGQTGGSETMSGTMDSRGNVLLGHSSSNTGSSKAVNSTQAKGSYFKNNDSLEWDFTGQTFKEEICTQTSQTVGTVDRASSRIPFESFSKESLLEDQTKPLAFIDQTTELEESDGSSAYDEDTDQTIFRAKEKVESPVAPIQVETEESRRDEEYFNGICESLKPMEDEDEEKIVDWERISFREGSSECEIIMEELFGKTEVKPVSHGVASDVTMETVDPPSIQLNYAPGTSSDPVSRTKIAEMRYTTPEKKDLDVSDQLDKFHTLKKMSVEVPMKNESAVGATKTRKSGEIVLVDSQKMEGCLQKGSSEFGIKSDTIPNAELSFTATNEGPSVEKRSRSNSEAYFGGTDSGDGRCPKSPKFIYRENKKPRYHRGRQGVSSSSLYEWQLETQLPKLNVSSSGGAIEIQPSPVQLDPSELQELVRLESNDLSNSVPAMAISVKSSLILHQSNSTNGKCLESNLELCNSTAFQQGYKILVNSITKDHLKISPSIGLIPPHEQAKVKISTLHTQFTNKEADKFRIIIKMFRAHCEGPSKLKQFYNELESQHPELIQSKTIDKVISWNHDDLPVLLDMIHSISDIEERERLRNELHRQFSGDLMLEESKWNTKQLLHSITTGLITANQNLRSVAQDLSEIRNTMMFLAVVVIVLIGVMYLGPLLTEKPQPQMNYTEPKPVPEQSTLLNIMNYLKSFTN